MFPEYPFQSYFTDIDGQRLHYLDEGPKSANPVVMVHGNPTWSFYYRKLVTALSNQYRCVVPDHIGMGLSSRPYEDEYKFTLDQRANDLEQLLDQLEINKDITLIVHDWGGMIGMAYATRYTDRIKRLVILNTAAFSLPENKSFPWQLVLCRIPVLGALLIQGFNLFCLGAVKNCVTKKKMAKEVRSAFLVPYNNWHNRLAVRKFVEDIPLEENDYAYETANQVESNLHTLKGKPMLICWGMKDFVFDKLFLEKWQQYFPDADAHTFEDAGHYILEDEAESVVQLIQNFMEK